MKINRFYISFFILAVVFCLISINNYLNINSSRKLNLRADFPEKENKTVTIPYFAIFKTVTSNYPIGSK